MWQPCVPWAFLPGRYIPPVGPIPTTIMRGSRRGSMGSGTSWEPVSRSLSSTRGGSISLPRVVCSCIRRSSVTMMGPRRWSPAMPATRKSTSRRTMHPSASCAFGCRIPTAIPCRMPQSSSVCTTMPSSIPCAENRRMPMAVPRSPAGAATSSSGRMPLATLASAKPAWGRTRRWMSSYLIVLMVLIVTIVPIVIIVPIVLIVPLIIILISRLFRPLPTTTCRL